MALSQFNRSSLRLVPKSPGIVVFAVPVRMLLVLPEFELLVTVLTIEQTKRICV